MAKKKQSASTLSNTCLCESSKPYTNCCEPMHLGEIAPTAEALMRSRYTAYVLGLDDYLRRTWHASTRPREEETLCHPSTHWLGLSVKQHRLIDATHATVEFVARYKIAGKAERMHEISHFEMLEGVWYYLDGEQLA